jgi:hypothetical protein
VAVGWGAKLVPIEFSDPNRRAAAAPDVDSGGFMAATAQGRSDAQNVREWLVADHHRLEALFADMVNASEAGVTCDVIGALWSRLEAAVLAHFELEEQQLFPLLARTHPVEVEQLRSEHADFRGRLVALDVEVDLHLVRHPSVLRLVEDLHEHAAREEQTVYAWADREIGIEARAALVRRVRALIGAPDCDP